MFCFLQLPYHPSSTVNISNTKGVINRSRLYQYYSTEMTAEVMQVTRRNLGEMDQKERRMLFRRSHSEPVVLTNEGVSMTSRTDPEWNMTVDSISLQSSFVDYQHKRKERLKKQEAHKKSEISISSEVSDMDMDSHPNFEDNERYPDVILPSTLSLSNSDDDDDGNSSNDISSSQAKEINYEEEMKLFMEKNGHLVTNVFADPFDSDERKSRTEQWVEKSTENLEEGKEKDLMEFEKKEEENKKKEEEDENRKPSIGHQSTEDSLLSSNVTVSSLKKSTYQINLKEATEAQSEIDVNEVDRFWDYLYEKEDEKNDDSRRYPLDGPSTSTSDRSLGMSLSPVKVEIAGIKALENHKRMEKDEEDGKEKDRELDEILEIHDQTVETGKFFTLETKEPIQILTRTTASQTPLPQFTENFIDNENQKRRYDQENIIRKFSFQLSENLFKDLKILIVERDRAKQAMAILPAKSTKELSEECNYFQTRYRVRIEQNKEKLDRKIDEIWKKLIKMPIESQDIIDLISVVHSGQLTLNARRNLPENFNQD